MNRTNRTLALGLAMLAVGAVSINQAYADHCPSDYGGKCKHGVAQVTVDIINATLYPAQNGSVLEMWLDVTPGLGIHNHISFGEIVTSNGAFFNEVCHRQDDGRNKLYELNRRASSIFKTCHFIPDYVNLDRLRTLIVGYEFEFPEGSRMTLIGYTKSISLRDVDFEHFEPVVETPMCEVPAATPPPTTTEPDTNKPQLLSAAYHAIFADLVLAFDEDVTLADGWQDSITVGGISIGERARNHVDGASGLAWISVEYSAGLNIRDVTPHTVIIEPGTFIDADGNTNDRIRVTPTITG